MKYSLATESLLRKTKARNMKYFLAINRKYIEVKESDIKFLTIGAKIRYNGIVYRCDDLLINFSEDVVFFLEEAVKLDVSREYNNSQLGNYQIPSK